MRFLQKVSSRLILVVLVAAGLGFVGLFVSQSFRIRDEQAQYAAAQAEFQQVQDRNTKLQQHLDFYAKSGGYMLYVEKVARESLGMAKPGETVILPISDNNGTLQSSSVPIANAAPPPTNPEPSRKANWQNWLGFFFGS